MWKNLLVALVLPALLFVSCQKNVSDVKDLKTSQDEIVALFVFNYSLNHNDEYHIMRATMDVMVRPDSTPEALSAKAGFFILSKTISGELS
jgi:hypothetical protein